MKCVIFRCSKKDEMYLYVPHQENEEELLLSLPDGLEKLTGRLDKVMALEITPERKLARVRAKDVLASLQEKGFYIQMPPNDILREDDSMLRDPSDSF